jgi:hypothetical protein
MVYRGQMKDGVVVLDGPKVPPEGSAVSVRVLKNPAHGTPRPRQPEATLYDRLKNIVGKAKGMPADASVTIDHYLYGAPKRR